MNARPRIAGTIFLPQGRRALILTLFVTVPGVVRTTGRREAAQPGQPRDLFATGPTWAGL
jgi:hypothetical protein